MKLKIVVIDDEESIRDTIKWYLEDLGHEVISCAEPLLCDVFKGHPCDQEAPCSDAVIVDYHMPRMNGLEFIETLVSRGCQGNAENVLLMSGDTTRIDMQRVEVLGCTVAQKPLPLDYLDKWIEKVLSRKKSPGNSTE